jgi:hypothetical protein
MEEVKRNTGNKGGRPPKDIRRNKLIGVKCSVTEKFLIEAKAKAAGMTRASFLRITGLNGKVDIRKKVIPNEVLKGIAGLNHIAANLNQIARKRNSFDELNALERAELQHIVAEIKQFVQSFRNYFQ